MLVIMAITIIQIDVVDVGEDKEKNSSVEKFKQNCFFYILRKQTNLKLHNLSK